MNRLIVLALGATGVVGASAYFAPAVELQTTTPGVAQIGHLNIDGTAKAGVLRASSVVGSSTAASGTVSGGEFSSVSISGRGVSAGASSSSGTTYGGYFYSASSAGKGVYGIATAASGSTNGGRFDVASPSGRGVYGYASASSGTPAGVFGQALSPTGNGVLGWATSPTGNNFGVYGQSDSPQGTGVYGKANALTGSCSGGVFDSAGSGGRGVTAKGGLYGVVCYASGTSAGARGLYATVSSSLSGYANYGYHPNGGFGLFANGNSGASGNKSFRIDHPSDPENKYLMHYSAEGPDVLNIYTGNIVTDSKGYATVKLPGYFADINRDPRYTLTVVDGGDDFVLVKVVRKVQNNQFVIRTSKPNVEVSWEVKGIRNDLFNRKYGAPVEVKKNEEEVGLYQRPELYGLGPERGIDAEVQKVAETQPDLLRAQKR